MSSLKYWVWLSTARGAGPVAGSNLLKRFGSPENVFLADAREYRETKAPGSADFTELSRKNTDNAERTLAACAKLGCRIITLQDAEYPERLRNIYDPPLVIFVLGHLPVVDDEAVVGIVGTRNCSPYGISSAERISYTLAKCGVVVATGLARGIDSVAARGALKGGGRVLGVIGSGVDVVYPKENAKLYDDVAGSGAVISEYPPGTPAVGAHFPARNRIISGLSLGVAVIEAPKKSGALITAARALEQGRDVFSLPGNVDSRNCEGSNALLRDGAIPILSGEDIVSEYSELFPDRISIEELAKTGAIEDKIMGRGDKYEPQADKKEIDNKDKVDYIGLDKIREALDGDEITVAETISGSVVHVDEIIVRSGISAQQVLTALTMLEIKGFAVRSGNGMWRLVRG